MVTGLDRPALIVIDVQKGFENTDFWGPRNNPACDSNIAQLIAKWRDENWPLVFVRHDSASEDSPLHPSNPGNQFKSVVSGTPDLLVSKCVNSSFHGTPDLHAWLQHEKIKQTVICGITTNHCCETTARISGNLGYETYFVLDATHTFDRLSPTGKLVPAETLAEITATNLHREFATVVSTAELLRK